MSIIPLILIILADPGSAKLTLIPNTTEILQRDNLLLLAVLENDSISAVRLLGKIRPGPRWFRHEIEQNGKWVNVLPSGDQLGPSDVAGDGSFLNAHSSYAEYDVLHRRSRDGVFLFETPGTYQIRVVATMSWGELPSEPVKITVRKRADKELRKIESIGSQDLWVLAVPRLDRPLPEKLLELRPVGGNIAKTIDNWLMAQIACEGGEWKDTRVSKEKACAWLDENMDPVAYGHSLEKLGAYYRSKRHWEALSRVVFTMKYDSMKKRGFQADLKRSTMPPTPAMP